MPAKEYDPDECADQGADTLAALILCVIVMAYIAAKTCF